MNLLKKLQEIYKSDQEKGSDKTLEIISELGNFTSIDLKKCAEDQYSLILYFKNDTYTLEYNKGDIHIKSSREDGKKIEIRIDSEELFLLSKRKEKDDFIEESIKLEYKDGMPIRLTFSRDISNSQNVNNKTTIIEPDKSLIEYPEHLVIDTLKNGISLGKRVVFGTIEGYIKDKESKDTFNRIMCNIDNILPLNNKTLDFLLEELSSHNFQRLQLFMSSTVDVVNIKEKTAING